jgi:hypothetical protein
MLKNSETSIFATDWFASPIRNATMIPLKRSGTGMDVLRRLVEPMADDVRVRRAEANGAVIRRYTETRYGAKSWRVGGELRLCERLGFWNCVAHRQQQPVGGCVCSTRRT